jgi:hypothetical protein
VATGSSHILHKYVTKGLVMLGEDIRGFLLATGLILRQRLPLVMF